MEFVIRENGHSVEKGYWVLTVDPIGERFLIAKEDGIFRWVAMADCTLVRGMNPDMPRPVISVQLKQGLTVPKMQIGGNGRK